MIESPQRNAWVIKDDSCGAILIDKSNTQIDFTCVDGGGRIATFLFYTDQGRSNLDFFSKVLATILTSTESIP